MNPFPPTILQFHKIPAAVHDRWENELSLIPIDAAEQIANDFCRQSVRGEE